jgi:hypothetical protein
MRRACVSSRGIGEGKVLTSPIKKKKREKGDGGLKARGRDLAKFKLDGAARILSKRCFALCYALEGIRVSKRALRRLRH